MEPEKEEKKPFGEFHNVLHDFVVILAVITVLFVFVIRLVGVSGPSMTPTLLNGEYVALLSNFLSDSYKQGDIVVATIPTFDDSQPIVKRVIATAGQTVDIDFTDGEVRVDGELLEESYINELTLSNYDDGLTYPVTVPEGCVFLMGDNRNHSTDSRYAPIGCVSTEYILGKVILRIYPISRIGRIS
ncbi:MAG: signal peptidase I [Oscillospiraceae bacterium]|nr:signal peptidase I [Oscillospiraceae bacterium]